MHLMLCKQLDSILLHLTLTTMASLMPLASYIQDTEQNGVVLMHTEHIIQIEFGHTSGLSTHFQVESGQAAVERAYTIITLAPPCGEPLGAQLDVLELLLMKLGTSLGYRICMMDQEGKESDHSV
jgi:hypothetical protein